MDNQVFLTLLMSVSVFTGLATEAIKQLYGDKPYSSNMIAIVTSVIASILISALYAIDTEVVITVQFIAHVIELIILSALASMCGYDKIVQAIKQIKNY